MESLLLDWSLRAILMAAGTAAALGILRVRTAAARHLAWAGVLAAMLLLPALTAWGPKVAVPLLPASREQLVPEPLTLEEAPMRPASQNVAPPDARASRPIPEAGSPKLREHWTWNWGWIALATYFTGFGVMLIRLVAGTIQARVMVRRATLVDGMLVSAQCASPVTVGWIQPVVVLPESWRSWSEAKLDAVLTHEREHVRRRDPLVRGLALLNRTIFWFHPLAWWLERKLSDLAEEACDAVVLERGHTPQDYSQYLIDLARSVEGAGARIRVWGSRIDGSTLPGRIRRILDSRTLTPLSRTRAAVTAALCLSVLAVFSACKPERAASKLAPGQPTMNELMHRRAAKSQTWEKQRQALMDEVQKLTPDQARALEAQLKTNPQDRDTLIKVVRYYQYRLGGKGFSAITLWYIEHQPAMPWGWNINPEWDRAGYEKGKKLWLAHLKKPGAEAAIYRNAARFLEGGDKPLAEQALLDGQKAYPNEKWSMELGNHYSQALLGSVGPLAEFNVIRSISMKDAHGPYAQSVRMKLAASNDPQVLMQTAQHLANRSLKYLFGRQNPLGFDVITLAKSYNDRALSLKPDDLSALSLKVRLRDIEFGLRIRNMQPDQLSQSDRLKMLQNKLDEAFWKKKTDEAESSARELLALAAQNPNDSEYGNAVFFANLTLSDITLQRGDKRQAARYLLAASEAPPTDRLRYDYIDMTLARQLVDWGEREAVAQFLDRCARFNQRGKDLAEWAAQIRQGINPDLTPLRSN